MDVVEEAVRKLTEMKLRNIAEYYSELEQKFAEDIETASNRFDTTELDEELVDVIADETQKIDDVFLQALRASLVIAIYSFLEGTMNSLCRHLKKRKGVKVELEDNKKAEGIERAKAYLTEECRINFPDKTNEWNEIAKLNKLRNCFVHAGGDLKLVKKNQQQLYRNTFKSMRQIEINDNRVTIKKEYIPAVLGKVETFLDKLYDEAFMP